MAVPSDSSGHPFPASLSPSPVFPRNAVHRRPTGLCSRRSWEPPNLVLSPDSRPGGVRSAPGRLRPPDCHSVGFADPQEQRQAQPRCREYQRLPQLSMTAHSVHFTSPESRWAVAVCGRMSKTSYPRPGSTSIPLHLNNLYLYRRKLVRIHDTTAISIPMVASTQPADDLLTVRRTAMDDHDPRYAGFISNVNDL